MIEGQGFSFIPFVVIVAIYMLYAPFFCCIVLFVLMSFKFAAIFAGALMALEVIARNSSHV